jgi:CRP/FNR family transcriptional regulator, polysaccharide utilization system transcription regulator
MNKTEDIIPLYQELSTEQIELIKENSYVVKYKKNETIFRQDMPISHIITLKDGLVKLFIESEQDKNLILRIIPPNNFLGLISSFRKNQYVFSATAIVNSEVIFTDITVFKNLIKENGNYALNILKYTSDMGLFILDKLINLSHKQVPGRIAGIILFFSTEIFKSDEFEFPLTRQELADLISTTKESVSRTLSEFKNDRIIDINEKKITVRSVELLNTLIRIG